MCRRDPIQTAFLLTVLAAGLMGGCAATAGRNKEKSSTSILDTGPSAKVTSRQAADIQIGLGRSMEQEGKVDEARLAYLTALKKDPNRADAEVRLAILEDRKGEHGSADKHFARALKLQPKNPEILCDQGYSLYLRRRWADAETSLKKALAIDRAHARSHENLALVHARVGDNEGALAEFAKAGCDPSDARANLALVLGLEGRFEESRHEYALALAAKPASTYAKEGLKATAAVLSGKTDARQIAKNGLPALPPLDPALQRTTAAPGQ
jgi:Tfp pilus assembly protein PilF